VDQGFFFEVIEKLPIDLKPPQGSEEEKKPLIMSKNKE
jgi:hypothetical protein